MKTLSPIPKGQFLIITALSLVALIGIAGLAIDSGMGYLIKAKLNGAVDAAGIAAGRALPQGDTAARTAAEKFFVANYPEGWLGSNPNLGSVTFTRDSDSGRTYIDISATATRNVSLMAVLGFSTINVRSAAQLVRKDVDLALVLDTTGSIDTSDRPILLARAKEFLAKFNQNYDRIGLLHFASGTVVDEAIRTSGRGFDLNAMNAAIDDINFGGNTNFSEALWTAREQLNSIPSGRSPLRVIVFFSDGSPNSFASTFGFKATRTCSWPSGWPALTAAGTVRTGDSTSVATPSGLYRYDQQNNALDPSGTDFCEPVFNYNTSGTDTFTTYLTGMPQYYNPHPISDTEFLIQQSASSVRRLVTADLPEGTGTSAANTARTTAWRNINNAARNLAQDMAVKFTTKSFVNPTDTANNNIYVFTLGLSDLLHQNAGPNSERGENLLKAMANTTDAMNPLNTSQSIYDPTRNTGVYCWARTANDLGPCFDKMAAEILRLSK